MFDEHQDMQPLKEHGVHVQEIDCDDPGGLGVQELPPARARASRCRIDACRMQNLPHGGRRDCHAELCEFAVDPAVSPPSGFSLASRTTRRAMPGTFGGRPGLRRLLVSYFFAASLRCQASGVAGATGKTSAQRLRCSARSRSKEYGGPP
jgi:hypothetical protein